MRKLRGHLVGVGNSVSAGVQVMGEPSAYVSGDRTSRMSVANIARKD
jgi:hypothetical protein